MKKQHLFLGALSMLLFMLVSCKKEPSANIKSDMFGVWKVTKIETKVGSEPVSTVNYTVNDYIDFKKNNDDQVEMHLDGSTKVGSFLVLINSQFTMQFAATHETCNILKLTEKNFEFSSKLEGSNITKTYYLYR